MKKSVVLLLLLLGGLLQAQQAPATGTTICWDVSASMSSRDVEKDFSVLKKVFERSPNQQVQLLLFGIEVEEKHYAVKDGDWSELQKELEEVTYDGATVYGSLRGKIDNRIVYVFTDGQRVLSQDVLALEGKSFLINSSPARNADYLGRTALLNKSRLMDFAAVLPENVKALQQKPTAEVNEQVPLLKGTVYVDNKPAPDARVTVKGLSDSFLTGPSGGFSIPAQVGDTLVVTSRNSKTIKTVPVAIMAHTDVFMVSNIVALEEVVVVEKELEKTEMTLTGYGLQNKNSVGYAVSQIDEGDISEVTPLIGDAINTKIAGLEVKGRIEVDGQVAGGLGAAQIRGSGSINMNTNALVVVNGVPMKRSETTGDRGIYTTVNANMDFVDPANIASITVLKGLAATNAWGSEGRGGVILITTKTAVHKDSKTGKPVDRARLKNNIYKESEEERGVSTSLITSALEGSATIEDAYNIYLTLRELNRTKVDFYLDAFAYFRNKDNRYAKRVVSNLLELQTENSNLNRIVAQAFSILGDAENALRLNEELIKADPTDVNAYRNKAQAKIALGRYQEALNELLALRRGNTYFSVNASAISKTLTRDIKNLISRHKDRLNLTNVEPAYLNNLKYRVRLVFEWNAPGAEFELQFVNPQKRYFNWEHTNAALRSRLEDELKNNYRIEEYEFYGDVAGEWIINAQYLGDEKEVQEVPLMLKTTIYENFGQPNQKQEELLIHFTKRLEKRNLKKLQVN